MAIAKVILNGETLMDVTSNTVTSENLLSGQTAIDEWLKHIENLLI